MLQIDYFSIMRGSNPPFFLKKSANFILKMARLQFMKRYKRYLITLHAFHDIMVNHYL